MLRFPALRNGEDGAGAGRTGRIEKASCFIPSGTSARELLVNVVFESEPCPRSQTQMVTLALSVRLKQTACIEASYRMES